MTKELKDYTTQELFEELRDRPDVVGIKLWNNEDIEGQVDHVIECDFPEMKDKAEELKGYAINGDFSFLNDCTDQEWDYIYSEVYQIIKWFKENKENKHD